MTKYLGLALLLGFLFSCSSNTNSEQPLVPGDSLDEPIIDDTSKPKESQEVNYTKTIIFFGNSLTAGYGLSEEQAFPALLQERIDSLGLPYECVNLGNSGETTTGGLERLDWVLKNKPDIFVLELGPNDGLRGIDLSLTKKNLETIIDRVRAKYPDVTIILAGMEIPPNMGNDYTKEFSKIFKDIAQTKDVELVPFLLDGVAGKEEYNLADGIHPNAEGAKIVADNVWEVLKDELILM